MFVLALFSSGCLAPVLWGLAASSGCLRVVPAEGCCLPADDCPLNMGCPLLLAESGFESEPRLTFRELSRFNSSSKSFLIYLSSS
jgi:hypothetical protein